MESLLTNNKTINVLMFPWLAHGHISPYLELAKKLTKRNFIVHLCSTSANFSSVKNKIGEKYAFSIHLVELKLPTMSDFPSSYHTTNGLPPDLMPTLKIAFEKSKPEFSRILADVNPDLLIYDFLQPWAPLVASRANIPAVEFITSSSTMTAFMFHHFKDPKIKFPFDSIFYREYESMYRDRMLTANEKVKSDFYKGVERSSEIVLVKGFREIEHRYINYLSSLLGKKFVPVGPLVQNPSEDADGSEVIQWLNKKGNGSTVFVSFGTEYFLKKNDIEEIAHGLEISNVNFIWVLRFPKGVEIDLEAILPQGFLARVGDRGLVLEGWAPQAKILGHASTGGFVSHCGVSSMMESMKFGVPIIAVPMHLDQPINARLVGEIGVGMEVLKNELGVLERETLAQVIRHVLVEGVGQSVRNKARQMNEKIAEKGDHEIDEVVSEFVKLIQKRKKNSVW